MSTGTRRSSRKPLQNSRGNACATSLVSQTGLAEEHDVEGVVSQRARVAPGLDEDAARGVRGRTRPAFGAAAARARRRFAALVGGVVRVRAGRQDRMTGDRAPEAQDVRAGSR